MNVPVRARRPRRSEAAIVDCDIHPAFRTPADLLSVPAGALARAHDDLRRASAAGPVRPAGLAAHDGGAACASTRFPEDGPPGSDLELMRRQHLDANGVEYGMLMQLSRGGMEERNLDFAAALSRAVNDWQLEAWVKPEPRLRAGIVVPQEDAAFAVSEIERARRRSGASPRS